MDDLRMHGLIGGGGSNIKSIQSGVVTLSSANSIDVAISSVDLTKAVVICRPHKLDSTVQSGDKAMPKTVFKNATTITLSVNTKPTYASQYYWCVIEFQNIKSLQSGSAFATLAGTTINITAINTQKSILLASYTSSDSGTDFRDIFIQYTISSATALLFKIGYSSQASVQWFVIEFK